MNCEKFDQSVTDLARGQLMESGVRDEALAHLKTCAACEARYEQEQNLSVALRVLAVLDENRQASQHIEVNLLAAFRQQAKTNAASSASGGQFAQRASRKNLALYWLAAAALLLIAITIFALRPKPVSPQPQARDNAVQPPQPEKQPNEVSPQPKNDAPQRDAVGYAPKKNRRDINRQIANHSSTTDRRNNHRNITGTDGKTNAEIATDFIVLHNLPMNEGGQLVRVELPSSALASFGLPVNYENANQRVKADVVLGNDGIARAIRFVR
ncbi:MAG: hypothetical protein AB1757_04895 [Acidobacteriota bacterium]